MEFVIIAVLIISNGILAMSEIALVSLRKANLAADAKRGSKSAKRAIELAENPERFFSTVQIGITLIGILTGIYSGDAIAGKLGARLRELGIPASWAVFGGQAAVLLARPHSLGFPFDPGGVFSLPDHTPMASSLTLAAIFPSRPHSDGFSFDPSDSFPLPDHKKDALRASLSFHYILLILPAHFSLHPQRITIQFFCIKIDAVHIHRIPLWIFICRIIIDPL